MHYISITWPLQLIPSWALAILTLLPKSESAEEGCARLIFASRKRKCRAKCAAQAAQQGAGCLTATLQLKCTACKNIGHR